MNLEISNLADHPELVPVLADWFYKEWGGRWPSATLKGFTERLRRRMNRNRPPFTLIAFYEGKPVGTAALKIQEMETHPQYEYWLGSVYVREEHRGQGIASELIKAVAEEASHLEIDTLYLYTRGKEGLYTKFGWEIIEQSIYRGREATIMKRILSSPRPSG